MEDIRSRFAAVVYREHALQKALERGIDPAIIKEAIQSDEAEIIEPYPDERRGPACLVLGWWNVHRALHVELGLGSPLCIITVYDPAADPKNRWESDFKTRRRTAR